MRKLRILILTFLVFAVSGFLSCKQESKVVRFATFNTSLYRTKSGEIDKDLQSGKNEQMKIIAEIIQRNKPDVLTLQEFDYEKDNKYLKLFCENYLEKAQNDAMPILYPYVYAFPSNTGKLTEYDLNNDGKFNSANDAYGFGAYPGQYAFAVLSRFPLDTSRIRTFQYFLWKDMPSANLPELSDSVSYYTEEELNIFRLSSKNHVDIPVVIFNDSVHILIAHPTPPVFDGPEDRNGKRNHDEIRLFADYISGGNRADYIYDDKAKHGGLIKGAKFIIMGDMNADPTDGDSFDHAILQLINHPLINSEVSKGKFIPKSEGSAVLHKKKPDNGDPRHNTSVYGLRIDYVLPSTQLKVISSGVFWPTEKDDYHYLVKGNKGTDHRLVWVDIEIK